MYKVLRGLPKQQRKHCQKVLILRGRSGRRDLWSCKEIRYWWTRCIEVVVWNIVFVYPYLGRSYGSMGLKPLTSVCTLFSGHAFLAIFQISAVHSWVALRSILFSCKLRHRHSLVEPVRSTMDTRLTLGESMIGILFDMSLATFDVYLLCVSFKREPMMTCFRTRVQSSNVQIHDSLLDRFCTVRDTPYEAGNNASVRMM